MKLQICIISLLLFSCTQNSTKSETPVVENTIDSVPMNQRGKIISDSTNILEKKVHHLELMYLAWGCACANWIAPADYEEYKDSSLEKHCIFIEPANKNLIIPDSFQPDGDRIYVTGQFYVREDYPQGTIQTEEYLEKAKVFRYTSLKIIKKAVLY